MINGTDKNSKSIEIQELFELLQLGIKKFGVNKVYKTLKELIYDSAYQNESPEFKKKFNTIIAETCNYFDIDERLIFNRNTRGDAKVATKISFILTIKLTEIKVKSLANIYGRSRQTLYTYQKDFEKRSYDNKVDRKQILDAYIEIYEIVEKKLKQDD